MHTSKTLILCIAPLLLFSCNTGSDISSESTEVSQEKVSSTTDNSSIENSSSSITADNSLIDNSSPSASTDKSSSSVPQKSIETGRDPHEFMLTYYKNTFGSDLGAAYFYYDSSLMEINVVQTFLKELSKTTPRYGQFRDIGNEMQE